MRCRSCGSVMIIDHCESGTGATTCWYACSLCHTVRLTSQPDHSVTPGLAATARSAEEDSTHAPEPLIGVPEMEV